jgi:prolyl-tRNA synthetase
VRLAIGPRDLENETVELARRDTKEKMTIAMADLTNKVIHLLDAIQSNMYLRAADYRDAHITPVNSWEEFIKMLDTKGGFLSAHWDGTGETEQKIKEATKATIRCIPLDAHVEKGTCIFSGKPSERRVLFARAY